MKTKIHYKVGLERESLRLDKDGKKISNTKHPTLFGDPLTNKFITMDFAESQLELATPVFSSNKKALHWIDMTIAFIMQQLQNETLWPMSTPPPFDDDVAIATFGNSKPGKDKHLYRRGLRNRFGLEKQLLSGYHYNFSFQDTFLNAYKKEKESTLPLRYFATECYLHIMRNFMRYGWIIPYFYGTSVFPLSSMKKGAFPFATSLRQSRYGYTNEVQQSLALNYNLLQIYVEQIKGLTEAICPAYEKYGDDQLSNAILQIPNEIYSCIRPKRIPNSGQSEIMAIEQEGIQYLEIRLLDINPLFRTGTSLETLSFVKDTLLFCLFMPSQELSEDEFFQTRENHFLIAEKGLEKDLTLTIQGKTKSVTDWIAFILSKMDIPPPEIMPDRIRKVALANVVNFGAQQARRFASEWKSSGCSHFVQRQIESEILMSNIKRHIRESNKPLPIEPIKEMEMSTQVVIKDALEKGIDVQILDKEDHFIQLQNRGVKEVIQKATCTSKDPFVNILMKGSKSLTKKILEEHDISTPRGITYSSKEKALKDRLTIPIEHVVIKPNSTNMGVSVHFVNTTDIDEYEKAVSESFKHEDQIIVEEYVTGNEFRFLIIDFKVVAISNRVPANVIGNNKDTIETLIEKKNRSKMEKVKIRDVDDPEVLNRVLRDGEMHQFRKQSNVSTGGDAIDCTDDIDLSYTLIAQRAAKALGSRICGVDMIIKDEQLPATPENYSIIELNYNPMLSIHTHPDVGKPRDVTTPIFKLLGLL